MTFNPTPYDILEGLQNWALVVGITFATLFLATFVLMLLLRGVNWDKRSRIG